MRCSKCRRLLVEFSEGCLENDLAGDVVKHISTCASCRRDLDDLRSSLRLMEDAREIQRIPEPSADFTERLMERVRQTSFLKKGLNATTAGIWPALSRRHAFGGIIALCCLLAFIAVVFFHRGASDRATPSPATDNRIFTETETESPDSLDRMPALPEADMAPLYQVRTHISMELVRLLEQTLEVIEGGEQKWEVEI